MKIVSPDIVILQDDIAPLAAGVVQEAANLAAPAAAAAAAPAAAEAIRAQVEADADRAEAAASTAATEAMAAARTVIDARIAEAVEAVAPVAADAIRDDVKDYMVRAETAAQTATADATQAVADAVGTQVAAQVPPAVDTAVGIAITEQAPLAVASEINKQVSPAVDAAIAVSAPAAVEAAVIQQVTPSVNAAVSSAVPPAVETAITEQSPPLIEAAVQAQAPALIETEVTSQVAAQVGPAVGFETWAEAAASHVPAVVNTLRVGALAFKRDPAGTALTTADGQKWSPDGTITPFHFGGVGDGIADDTAAIRAAVAYAASTGNGEQWKVVDGEGGIWGITGEIVLNKTKRILFDNFLLSVIGGFEDDTSSISIDYETGQITLNGTARYAVKITGNKVDSTTNLIRNLRVLCNHITNGVGINNTSSPRLENIQINGQKSVGIRTWPGNGTTDMMARNISVHEILWSAAQDPMTNVRQSVGIMGEGADTFWDTVVCAYCLVDMYQNGEGLRSISNFHPYNVAPHGEWNIRIAGAADSGVPNAVASGNKIRITSESPHGMVTGNRVLVPWLDGISNLSGAGGDGWSTVTVIDATTLDLDHSIFGGTYVPPSTYTPVLQREEGASIGLWVGPNTNDVRVSQIMLDGVSIRAFSPGLALTGGRATSSTAKGQASGYPWLDMRVTAPDESLFGLTATGVRVHSGFGNYRVTTHEGGSLATITHDRIDSVPNEISSGGGNKSYSIVPGSMRYWALPGSTHSPSYGVRWPTDLAAGRLTSVSAGFYGPAPGEIAYASDGIERFRWDDQGRMTVGYPSISKIDSAKPAAQYTAVNGSPVVSIHAKSWNSAHAGTLDLGRARGAPSDLLPLPTGSTMGVLRGSGSDGSEMRVGGQIAFYAENSWSGSSRPTRIALMTTANGGSSVAERWTVRADGHLYPSTTTTYDLGAAWLQVRNIYLQNAPIIGSDERLKQDIREVTEAERRVAQNLKDLLRAYRLKSAVALKGDEARTHIGVIAQDVVAAFEAEGLDPWAYAICCYDEWEARSAILGEDGEEVSPAVEAGEALSINYTELLAFILAAA